MAKRVDMHRNRLCDFVSGDRADAHETSADRSSRIDTGFNSSVVGQVHDGPAETLDAIRSPGGTALELLQDNGYRKVAFNNLSDACQAPRVIVGPDNRPIERRKRALEEGPADAASRGMYGEDQALLLGVDEVHTFAASPSIRRIMSVSSRSFVAAGRSVRSSSRS